MTAFILKIIAILGMTANHIAHAFGGEMPDGLYYALMMLGGLTFPIMAYLMSEGYKYTKNMKKYAGRLFIFACISLVPFYMALGYYMLNVLFTFLIGLGILYLDEQLKKRWLFWLIFIGAILFTACCDWAFIGVPMILCYHTIKNRYARVIVPVSFMWLMTAFMGVSYFFLPDAIGTRQMISQALYGFIGCTATIPILLSYKGERGRSMKYFFYAYYPAHLAVLAILKMIFL
jgi:TraX protein.